MARSIVTHGLHIKVLGFWKKTRFRGLMEFLLALAVSAYPQMALKGFSQTFLGWGRIFSPGLQRILWDTCLLFFPLVIVKTEIRGQEGN